MSQPISVSRAAGSGGLTELVPDDLTTALHRLTGWALEQHVTLTGLEVIRPSLEDVYLELTGGPAEPAEGMQAGFLGHRVSLDRRAVRRRLGSGRPAPRRAFLQLGAAQLSAGRQDQSLLARDRTVATSYSAMPAATPAFSDSVRAAIGIRTSMSQV